MSAESKRCSTIELRTHCNYLVEDIGIDPMTPPNFPVTTYLRATLDDIDSTKLHTSALLPETDRMTQTNSCQM